jgi:penicillin-binding protein-related factor A (putative recombinase)
MFNLEFILEGNITTIQIDGNEPMKKATEKFFIKTNSEIDYTYFLYNGYQFDLNEKISNIASSFDRENGFG